MYIYGHHRVQHTFPTRRSSDLSAIVGGISDGATARGSVTAGRTAGKGQSRDEDRRRGGDSNGRGDQFCPAVAGKQHPAQIKSEEHTSELQSRRDLVCSLLLEKK